MSPEQKVLYELMRCTVILHLPDCNLFWPREIPFLSKEMKDRIFLVMKAVSVAGLNDWTKCDIVRWLADIHEAMLNREKKMRRHDLLPEFEDELLELYGWCNFLDPLIEITYNADDVLKYMLKYVAKVGYKL